VTFGRNDNQFFLGGAMGFKYIVIVCLCLGCLFQAGGCTSSSNVGNQKLTADKVNQIQKGVTTRSEVEQLLGPCELVSIRPDGRRVMSYSGSQMKGTYSGQVFSGMTGGLVPGSDTKTMRREMLQIYLDGNDVVQDYEFSDTTTEQKSSVSDFGGYNGNETTTSNLPTTQQ